MKRLCRIGKVSQERVVALQRVIQSPDILERDGAGKLGAAIDRVGYFVKAAAPTTCLVIDWLSVIW